VVLVGGGGSYERSTPARGEGAIFDPPQVLGSYGGPAAVASRGYSNVRTHTAPWEVLCR